MAILLHGTTRWRAERIIANGPDPNFIEPGGGPRAENFSTYVDTGPFIFGSPEEYARLKANGFPSEGGPVILVIDVPTEIIDLAVNATFLPLSQGVVQFDRGGGLDELLAAWPTLAKYIVELDTP